MARRQDFEVFVDKFEPEILENDESLLRLYETYGEDIKIIGKLIRDGEENRLWTIIEGSSGRLYIAPGLHYVNRLNYLITKNPWQEGQRDYKY